MRFRYFGETARTYPDIVIPGEGTLVANPGDEREFAVPPDHHWWAEVHDPVKPPAKPKAKD